MMHYSYAHLINCSTVYIVPALILYSYIHPLYTGHISRNRPSASPVTVLQII